MQQSNYPSNGRDYEVRVFSDYATSPNVRKRPSDYPINDDNSPIKVVKFNAVGGSTVMYTAHYPRLHPSDLRVRTLDGVADDWPIDYATMEPFFAKNDRMTGVSGGSRRGGTLCGADDGALFPVRRASRAAVRRDAHALKGDGTPMAELRIIELSKAFGAAPILRALSLSVEPRQLVAILGAAGSGKTPVLEGGEWRKLLESIPTETVRVLRDRALIATLTYSFARIGAALKMKDLRPRESAWTIRLHEKGGKQHGMPRHHTLAEMLHAYIAAASIAEDRKGWVFHTSRGHTTTALSDKPMIQSVASRMIRRRAVAAGINTPIGNHSFRATGITAYLSNGSALEHAQEMAAHESPRTTKLYDRTKERLTQDEVVRIRP